MNKVMTIFFIIVTVSLVAQSYQFYDNEGNPLSLDEVVTATQTEDIVFFGEFHDDLIIHQLELEYLEKMFAQNNDIIISMEMFERDTQSVIDQYLEDEISEEEFILQSRAWSNYLTSYKPLVEFGKSRELLLLAANIPRKYAALVNKSGYGSIPTEAKEYVAKKHKVFKDRYYDEFVKIMKENMKSHGGMPMTEEMIDPIYEAQCIKDDTMAESILAALGKNPENLVIHYNGDFHSRFHLGTAQKLALLDKDLSISVISSVYSDGLQFQKAYSEYGDILLVVKK